MKKAILVHRRQLMDQWIERLTTYSSVPRDAIGIMAGGRRKPKGQKTAH
jgi:superfamily II DNA or RNA helicase